MDESIDFWSWFVALIRKDMADFQENEDQKHQMFELVKTKTYGRKGKEP